ncbi:MAG: hypothetical protein BWY75_01699 [bacterium ADurb.Bin425]|nr:MAG: hypothetical protein BWY75_01699 [bacterium ADurb.Bin425]
MSINSLDLRAYLFGLLGFLTNDAFQVGEFVLFPGQFASLVFQLLSNQKLLITAFFSNFLFDATKLGSQANQGNFGLIQLFIEALFFGVELFNFFQLGCCFLF